MVQLVENKVLKIKTQGDYKATQNRALNSMHQLTSKVEFIT